MERIVSCSCGVGIPSRSHITEDLIPELRFILFYSIIVRPVFRTVLILFGFCAIAFIAELVTYFGYLYDCAPAAKQG